MLVEKFAPIPSTVLLIILLYSEHLEANTSATLPEKVIIVTDREKYNITSPNFPGCCEPMQFVLRRDKAFINYYWKVIFTDVDLPEDSELSIYGQYENGGQRILRGSAKLSNGVWSHPAVSFRGSSLVIVYSPGTANDEGASYAGLKATYWLDNERWINDISYTDCPVIKNVQEGSIIVKEMDETKLLSDPQNYIMYCMWQFKPLKGKRKRLITIDEISPDSNVQIHRGVTSANPVIFSTSDNGKNWHKTFTSNKGFYISLKKRNVGRFVLSYRSGLETPDVTCPNGRCQNGECPKYEHHTCPELPCPGRRKRCEGTIYCIKYSQSCPGKKCSVIQEKCADGLCIYMGNSETCPDGSKSCGFMEKRCKNGDCLDYSKTCPENRCPPDKSFKCGDQCISESLKCDGVMHCNGGQDELFCIKEFDFDDFGKKEYKRSSFNWKNFLAIFGCVPFLVFCCYSCCNTNSVKRSPPPREGVQLNPQTENQPYRHPSLTATPVTYDPLSQRRQLLNTYPVDAVMDQTDSNASFLGPWQQPLTPPSAPQIDSESEPPSVPLPSIVTDNPPAADSSRPPSPPPSYGVVMSNRDLFLPPPNYESVVESLENETNA